MITFSDYNKIRRYIKRNIFTFLFSKSFKKFGKKVYFIDPDIIEGEKYISLDDNVSFGSKTWLSALNYRDENPEILIKKGTIIGRFAHIIAINEIVIDENVLISDKVYISDNLHQYKDTNTPIIEQEILFKDKVYIGKNSWIGENVSIIGVTIGQHCVIGANSVVTTNIPDYCIAVGVPAKVIKRYTFNDNKWIKC